MCIYLLLQCNHYLQIGKDVLTLLLYLMYDVFKSQCNTLKQCVIIVMMMALYNEMNNLRW